MAVREPKLAAVAKKTASSKAGPKAAAPRRRNGLSRDKILTVATGLFAERGFAGVSIRDIAGACGIGIPSIYHFFGDKDSLYVSCCQQIFGEVETLIRESFEKAASAKDRVRNITLTLCEILLSKRDFRRLLQMGLLQDDDRGIENITFQNFMSTFRLFVRGISELVGEKGAEERASMIFALVFGQIELHRAFQLANADITEGDPEELARYVLDVALPGRDWKR